MRLVYVDDGIHTPPLGKRAGDAVEVGDVVLGRDCDAMEVTYFREPHKPSSEGKVSVKYKTEGYSAEYYVSIIGAEWVEREDRLDRACTAQDQLAGGLCGNCLRRH